ncbi:hypothetical protein [Plasmodium yoelii yoelii]|uniref:Uncharacterized protein n=1 Tax=Plasmodium yoelii yoelii TaxID=73239 RepID=Q7RH64_PLAYO|nr:hypothetical protein [Plasmodium yoelii yoelii]
MSAGGTVIFALFYDNVNIFFKFVCNNV